MAEMVKGRTTYDGRGPHAHTVYVDAKGNGIAVKSKTPGGDHEHLIKKFHVLRAHNHTHDLV